MATQDLTTIPTAIAGLSNGNYFVQNLGSQPMNIAVRTSTQAAPAADSTDILVLEPLNNPFLQISKSATNAYYVWNGSGAGSVSIQDRPFD